MNRIAAVLVTHNSERWIEATLTSLVAQSLQPDEIIVVDDASTDATGEIVTRVLGTQVRVLPSTATSDDASTRIAHNFRQGISAARGCDIAVLGDHDDVWHADRVAHQAALLDEYAGVTLVASDGRLVDEGGRPLGGTLRNTFRVPVDINELSPEDRMRVVLRKSVATGGASAVLTAAFADVTIPAGWLHDRWWSLVAAAREELLVDDAIVIDYRVSADQEVGLDTGSQGQAVLGRMMSAAGGLRTTMNKLDDIRELLPAYATDATRPSLTGPRLLRNLM
jgi:glycosyltransferase involved in cell wall biosynthesis